MNIRNIGLEGKAAPKIICDNRDDTIKGYNERLGTAFTRAEQTNGKEQAKARKPEAEEDGYDGLEPPPGVLRDTGLPIIAPPYLVKNTIPKTGIGLLVGQSGMAKTAIAMHLGVTCAAFGDCVNEDGSDLDFFGRRVKECIGVVYMAFEGGEVELSARMRAAKEQRGITTEIPFVWCTPKSIGITSLSNPKDKQKFILFCKKTDKWMRRTFDVKLQMVIGDTAQAAYNIEKIESNSEIAALSKDFREMINEIGCGFGVLIHHAGKDASKGALGASNFRAFFDIVLMASGERDEQTGMTRNRKLAQSKNRDGIEGPIASFDVGTLVLGKDQDGDDFTAMVIVPNMAAKAPAADKRRKRETKYRPHFEQAFNNAIRDNPVKRHLIAPANVGSPEVVAVKVDYVREEFYRICSEEGKNAEDTKDAKRVAFNRELPKLFTEYPQEEDATGTRWIWKFEHRT